MRNRTIVRAGWCASQEHLTYTKTILAKEQAPFFIPPLLAGKDNGGPCLRKYMGVNGDRLNAILHSDVGMQILKRFPDVKDKNDKFLLIHQSPEFRLYSYLTAFEVAMEAGDTKTTNVVSLEFIALNRYLDRFWLASPPGTEFSSSYRELTEHIETGAPPEIWKGVALWPSLAANLKNWKEHPREQKENIAMAIYAIATLAGTCWPIDAAGEIEPEIKHMLLSTNGQETSDNAQQVTGADAIGGMPGNSESRDRERKWKEMLQELAGIAVSAQESKPSSAVADRLSELAESCLFLADSYQASGLRIASLVERIKAAAREVGVLTKFEFSEVEVEAIGDVWEDALAMGLVAERDVDSAAGEVTVLAQSTVVEQLRLTALNDEKTTLDMSAANAVERLLLAKKKSALSLAMSIAEEAIENNFQTIFTLLNREGEAEAPGITEDRAVAGIKVEGMSASPEGAVVNGGDATADLQKVASHEMAAEEPVVVVPAAQKDAFEENLGEQDAELILNVTIIPAPSDEQECAGIPEPETAPGLEDRAVAGIKVEEMSASPEGAVVNGGDATADLQKVASHEMAAEEPVVVVPAAQKDAVEENLGEQDAELILNVTIIQAPSDEQECAGIPDPETAPGLECPTIELTKEAVAQEVTALKFAEGKEDQNWAIDSDELSQMAAEILKDRNFSGPQFCNLVSVLIADRNFAAAWITSSLAVLNGGKPPVNEVLLKVLALAPYVSYSDGEMANTLSELISKDLKDAISKGEDGISLNGLANDRHVASLLVVAACLRPALIAPQTAAAAILQQVRLKDTDDLYKLVQSVTDFGTYQLPLDMSILKNSMSRAVWKDEVEKAKENAAKWLENAYQFKIKYIPAIKVWRNWLEPGGFVQRAVALVVAGDISKLPQLKLELKRLSDISKIDNEIERTDDLLRHARSSNSSMIDFQANKAIHNFTAEACALLQRFIFLVENPPGERSNFSNQLVDNLRSNFMINLEPARMCLNNLIGQNWNLLGLAARTCLDTINDVALFFDPQAPASLTEPLSKHLLYRQSLFTLDWETDENWQPKFGDPAKAAEDFVRSLTMAHKSLEQMFTTALECKNHTVTERIIEVLDAEGKSELVEAYGATRALKLVECRKGLRVEIDSIVKKAGESFNYGCIDEFFYNKAMARLSTMLVTLESITDFGYCGEEIKQFNLRIDELTRGASASITAKFEALNLDRDSSMYQLIRKKLDACDYAMASEFIERAAEGEVIPPEKSGFDLFSDFSTRRLPLIEKFLEKNKVTAHTAASLRAGILPEEPGGLLSDGKRAAQIFEAYQYAGRKGQFTNRDDVKSAISALGFEIESLNPITGSKVYTLKVAPVADRSVCPVAMFGSKANGNYRVILFYGAEYDENILSEVTKAKEGAPMIAVVFGILTEARRRKLAKLCRERAKTFLVLDSALVYAAATSGIPPLAAIFRLALPWTFYNPYSEGGGAISLEMFYGRELEMASIVGNGENTTAFIYGGRQLGKTALLNMVAKQFHNGLNHIAVYIDLVAIGIGRALPMDHFWSILSKEFRAHKVLGQHDSVGREGKELDIIKDWLDVDPSRRILLFLDEADSFLSEDGKDKFRITGKLKRLKETMNGRFRVVFAGLHNVKRATEAKNDPLLQLGKAKCIGPMLSAADRRDATRLIEEPMASCGYLFESRALVWRVMALSLYSPSLIQIFCSKIIQHINSKLSAYDRQETPAPPYVITERDVNDAYRTQEIRDDITYRFNKTITLDDRYEVIACIIALDMLDKQGKQSTYDAFWLRAEARKNWPKGFDQYHGSIDAFNVLLKEMEGLGVLHYKDDKYSFRTSSIATMLGTMEEIMDRLWKERPEPLQYTPEIFRVAMDTSNPAKCAPLSVIELGSVCHEENAVVVVLGTTAGGVETLRKSVDAFGHTRVIQMDQMTKLSDFDERMSLELKKKPLPGTTIIYVDATNHWDDKWILSARNRVEKTRVSNSHIKVLFEGGATNIDYLVSHDQELPLDNSANLFRCLPWHREMVALWAEVHTSGPKANHIELLMERTGGWPELLYQFHKADQTSPALWEEKLEDICSFQNAQQAQKMLVAFGLGKSSYLPYYVILAELEKATAREICTLLESDHEMKEVSSALHWLYLAGMASTDIGDVYVIDPVVGRLLRVYEPASSK